MGVCTSAVAFAAIFVRTVTFDEDLLPRQPLRPRAVEPYPCHLVVVTRDNETTREVNTAIRFLQRLSILIEEVSLEDSTLKGTSLAAFQELVPEDTMLQLYVDGVHRHLSAEELQILRDYAGSWERWIVPFEVHCLAQLRWSDASESFILPNTRETIAFLRIHRTRRSMRCISTPDVNSELPVFANYRGADERWDAAHTFQSDAKVGLGNCPSVLFIPSSPTLHHRRGMLRRTWLSDFPGNLRPLGRVRPEEQSISTNNCMDYFFLTGWPSHSAHRRKLEEEREVFTDLITDCSVQDAVPHYGNLQHKFFKSLQAQHILFPHAEYFVRASDDTYLHVPRMMNLLDAHGGKGLYLGREMSLQSYQTDWPLHEQYMDTFGHVGLPKVMLGDVMAISTDLAQFLVEAQDNLRPWAHFDDTVGIWLSTTNRLRRVGALGVDREWIEYKDVMRGDVECPEGRLVVAHSPSWKGWQNPFEVNSEAYQKYEAQAQDAILEFILSVCSMSVRTSGDPCLGDPEEYRRIQQQMLKKLSEYNWHSGVRLESHGRGLVHGAPRKAWPGFESVLDIPGYPA